VLRRFDLNATTGHAYQTFGVGSRVTSVKSAARIGKRWKAEIDPATGPAESNPFGNTIALRFVELRLRRTKAQ
jgi:hypothetical protein